MTEQETFLIDSPKLDINFTFELQSNYAWLLICLHAKMFQKIHSYQVYLSG